MERTLVLLKPDAVQRGMVGAIISRLEGRGLKIAGMKMLQMDQALAEKHYEPHIGKPFFPGLLSFITSGPLVAIAWEGNNAVEIVRSTMGVTNPVEASPGTIRGDYATDIGRNLVHGSDSLETAGREVALFFTANELIDYHRSVDDWVIEP